MDSAQEERPHKRHHLYIITTSLVTPSRHQGLRVDRARAARRPSRKGLTPKTLPLKRLYRHFSAQIIFGLAAQVCSFPPKNALLGEGMDWRWGVLRERKSAIGRFGGEFS